MLGNPLKSNFISDFSSSPTMTVQVSADTRDYSTRYSRYGWGIDVRATYAHLPCQPFWTWLTGKYPIHLQPRHPRETLLTPWQLGLQLFWSWSVIALSLWIGALLYEDSSISLIIKIPVTLVLWVLVTNRSRGLLHTFHYTNHGASISNDYLARFLGKWFMSVPIFHLTWDQYHKIHAEAHHAVTSLCTSKDPDDVFMANHGFYIGMPEKLFWNRLLFAPFHPRAIWTHIRFRLMHNWTPPTTLRSERFWRLTLALAAIEPFLGLMVATFWWIFGNLGAAMPWPPVAGGRSSGSCCRPDWPA